ncbi:MAG: hypothetical protein AAFR71_14665 [Pseudomonadota bacterium]
MSVFANFFRVGVFTAASPINGRNLTTNIERDRLARAMPGEYGARFGSRFGLML